MAQAIPPSPAPSNEEPLPSGFHHLVQHNTATSYPRDQTAMDPNSLNVISQPASRLGTPTPQVSMPPGYESNPPYQQGAYPYGYQQQMYPQETSQYGPLPDELHHSNHQPYSTPATSPPTPSQRSEVINLRSGAVRRNQALKPIATRTDRVQKPAPKKKKERAKAVSRVANLDKPLSELTKDWTHIPVVDIDGYVNRSVEERRREVQAGKTPGRVKRPMNAFMLYRKAYQTRTKDWCLQNNHQVVSQVCGQSWPLEPEAVREQFAEWARIERANHQQAHPDYKFTPAKPKNMGRKKPDSDDEGAHSEYEDRDWEAARLIRRDRSRTRTQTPITDPDSDYQPHGQPYHPYPYQTVPMQGRMMPVSTRSAYHYPNPHKLAPGPFDYAAQDHGYYQQQMMQPSIHHQMRGHGVEDMGIHKTPSPGGYHIQQHPGMVHHSYAPPPQRTMEQPQAQPQQFGQQVDPLLLSSASGMYDPNLNDIFDGSMNPSQSWDVDAHGQQTQQPSGQHSHIVPAMTFSGMEETLLQDQQTQVLRGDESSWQITPVLDEGQFDPWLEPSSDA